MGRNLKHNHKTRIEISEKFRKGYSVTQLASEYQVSKNTIKNYLFAENLWEKKDARKVDINNPEVRKLLLSSATPTEISKILGCSLDTVRRNRLLLEGKKDIPKTKRQMYVNREVTGGKMVIREIEVSHVVYKGKRYMDITEMISNLNGM